MLSIVTRLLPCYKAGSIVSFTTGDTIRTKCLLVQGGPICMMIIWYSLSYCVCLILLSCTLRDRIMGGVRQKYVFVAYQSNQMRMNVCRLDELPRRSYETSRLFDRSVSKLFMLLGTTIVWFTWAIFYPSNIFFFDLLAWYKTIGVVTLGNSWWCNFIKENENPT